MSLADLVIEDPRRSRVLEQFGLDYCCHGQQPLAAAAAAAGLDADEVLAALSLPAEAPAPAAPTAAITALAHDIVDTHHAYMWEEMPRLDALVEKVYDVHGASHPELGELRETYRTTIEHLDPHMTREERAVFPAMSRLEKGQRTPAVASLPAQVDALVAEHAAVGDLFARMHALTNGYTPPDDACASYQAMLASLKAMEHDLHEHIHLENNVLFPKALALAERLGSES